MALNFNLDMNLLNKELIGAGCIIAILVMDYLKIDDPMLKNALLGVLASVTVFGGVKNSAGIIARQPDPATSAPSTIVVEK